jgi:hypothetical protein
MEEKELDQRLHDMFKEMSLVLESMRQGFLAGDQRPLTEAETRLTRILTSNLPFTEKLIKKETKMKLKKVSEFAAQSPINGCSYPKPHQRKQEENRIKYSVY